MMAMMLLMRYTMICFYDVSSLIAYILSIISRTVKQFSTIMYNSQIKMYVHLLSRYTSSAVRVYFTGYVGVIITTLTNYELNYLIELNLNKCVYYGSLDLATGLVGTLLPMVLYLALRLVLLHADHAGGQLIQMHLKNK